MKPPSYSATAQLTFLCVMLVLVIYAMVQAGKPENWNWLFSIGGQDPSAEVEPVPTSEREAGTGDDSIIQRMPITRNATSNEVLVGQLPAQSDEFWKQMLESMSASQQLDWLQLVNATANQLSLPLDSRSRIRETLQFVERRFDDRLTRDQDDNPPTALEIQELWSHEWRPAMNAVVRDQPDPAYATDSVRALPAFFGNLSRQLLEDGRSLQRDEETYAWFDTWQNVLSISSAAQDPIEATVTSLLAQPNAYRGKSIRVQGKLLKIQRLKASENHLGLANYFVLWIRPNHVSQVPYCVYTSAVPASYEHDLNAVSSGNAVLVVDEVPIDLQAAFYKIQLYLSEAEDQADASQNRITNAPVLFAAQFSNTSILAAPARAPSRELDWSWVALLAAVGIYVFWRTRRLWQPVQAPPAKRPGGPRDWKEWDRNVKAETVQERLSRLTIHDDGYRNETDVQREDATVDERQDPDSQTQAES